MTNFKSFFWTILILLFSCIDGQTDNNNTTKQETPKVLQEDKLDTKSYSRSGDLIKLTARN